VTANFDVSEPDKNSGAGIHRYLVRYGLSGRVGRFGSIHAIACKRGDRVVVHTDRGIEPGEVLIASGDLSPSDRHPPAGELLRAMTREDERVLAALQQRQQAIVQRCRAAVAERGLALEIVDAESLLDARTTVLYFVGHSNEELGRLSVELASDPRERVRFEPLLLPGAAAEDDEIVESTTNDEGASPMKGPYERLKYDFRRVWECPACKRRDRTEGGVTFRQCNCTMKGESGQAVNMKMIEDGPRPRFPTRSRWPRLPEEIAAAAARAPRGSLTSAVEVTAEPMNPPPADPIGPSDQTSSIT
jgi:hypothetical protein